MTATRIYFQTSNAFPSRPSPTSWLSGWNNVSSAGTGSCDPVPQGTDPYWGAIVVTNDASTTRHNIAFVRFVGPLLAVGWDSTGTIVKGVIPCQESTTNAHSRLVVGISVINASGARVATLLPLSENSNEFSTSSNGYCRFIGSVSGLSLASYNAVADNYLVVELGVSEQWSSGNNGLYIYEDSNDLSYSESASAYNSNRRAWIEFSTNPFSSGGGGVGPQVICIT